MIPSIRFFLRICTFFPVQGSYLKLTSLAEHAHHKSQRSQVSLCQIHWRPSACMLLRLASFTTCWKTKTLSNVDIIQHYLKHIRNHEAMLHVLVEVAPEDKLLSFAKQLDEERAKGSVRGPLHGIGLGRTLLTVEYDCIASR